MKLFTLTFSILLFIFSSSKAQLSKSANESPSTLFNGFTSSTNVDSSFYFANKLAQDSKNMSSLRDLINNSFAQTLFVSRQKTSNIKGQEKIAQRLNFAHLLLDKMSTEGNKRLSETLRPIDYWVKIRNNQTNTEKQRELTEAFMASEFGKSSFYQNNTGRYALLIHQLISDKIELNDLSDQLLEKTISFLHLNQVKSDVNYADRDVLSKRAWQRFLLAYCNHAEGNKLMAQGNMEEAEKYFRTAFELSPDLTDLNHRSGYFYDSYMLTGLTTVKFKDSYLQFIKNHNPDKVKILNTLLAMALVDPLYKTPLKQYYAANFKEGAAFADYWLNGINASLRNSFAFSLRQMNGAMFSTNANKGKWILIDFWGTWCGPCRREHPDLQKFSDNVIQNKSRNISLITIACMDQESSVESYMRYNRYTFPVAMADEFIEKKYNIKSYPSKILITPQGKYIVIPFGSDWVSFIDNYTSI